MKKLILLSIVLLSMLALPLSMVAQPRLITYQGNILDNMDKPYQGPVQMTFELYDKEFGGTQLWSEIQNVSLNNGYFNVYLGSVTPFAPDFKFNRELWVQVTVGNGAPFKRTPLTMVPASFASEYSAVSGFAQDIPDGSVTLAKLAAEVINMGGDLTGQLPNPKLRPGAALENIDKGSITQDKLSPNVSTRPMGPASGDLTGFYPDPLIAPQAVKTDRIADFAVTKDKLALGAVTYDKIQKAVGPIGTILGWDGTKWVETNVPAWELGRVANVLPGDAAYAEYDMDENGFWEITVGVADLGITTEKIANKAVTYGKLQDATGKIGTILGWDGTKWIETDVPTWEADAVIGNEIKDVTPGRGLQRVGLGTFADPYTVGIANNGVITEMINNGAVTLSKIANGNTNGQVMWWDAVTNQWRLTTGAAPTDNMVMRWFDNGTTRDLRWTTDDAIIGNEVLNGTAGRGLVRAGAGTAADPYTLGINAQGVLTDMIADGNVTYLKLQNAVGPKGTILNWNGAHWSETNVPALEADGIIGNEVLNATVGGGLLRSGSGTAADPYTLGVAPQGIVNDMIAEGAVEYWNLQDAVGAAGTILTWDGGEWVEANVPMLEKDGVIGNEVLNATPGLGLIRAGSGTSADPFTLGVASQGIVNDMIAEGAVEYWNLQDAVGAAGTILSWDGGEWVENTVPMLEKGKVMDVVAGDGNYVNLVTDANGFITAEVGIDVGGIESYMIGSGEVEYWNLQDAAGAAGTILTWDGIQWSEGQVSDLEADGVIGNEVLNATANRGLVRAGSGTEVDPYTLGIAAQGIASDMIGVGQVTYWHLQDATGAAGTILNWDGDEWDETTVPSLEKGKQMSVTAGDGLYVNNTVDSEGFIDTEVGVEVGGITSDMLANGAVDLTKLAPGTLLGQIIWWDQTSNQWKYSAGAAPVETQVIKWVNNGSTMEPQWANDEMNIPFEKTVNKVETLFSLTNEGTGNVMELNAIDDLPNGGNVLVVNGGGKTGNDGAAALVVNRTTEGGLPMGAATVNATINTLDANSAGFVVNTVVNDDGNNAYYVDGMESGTIVTGGVDGVYYSGMWSHAEADNGIAIGLWGDSYGTNAQTNIGVIGDAVDAAEVNIGVIGAAKADYADYTTRLTPGSNVGVYAVNDGGATGDFGIISEVAGEGYGIYSSAHNNSALVAMSNGSDAATSLLYNYGNGPAMWAVGSNPASNGFANNNSVAAVVNMAGGRAMYVEGGAPNDENGGMPFVLDPANNDDAALIVVNSNAASVGGAATYATAIKTYGDIWANSAIGASEIIGLDRIVVGNPFTGPFIEILPPAFPGAPLTIDGDVIITGNLQVTDINAEDITAQSVAAVNGNFDMLNAIDAQFETATIIDATITNATISNAEIAHLDAELAHIDELNATLANLDVANINTANIDEANVNVANILEANIMVANIDEANINNLNVANGTFDDLLVNNSLELAAGAEFIADMGGVQGAGNAGDLLVSKGAGANPEWTTSVPFLSVNDLDVTNLATINELEVMNNGVFGGNVDVLTDLNVFGNAVVDGMLAVGGGAVIDNGLDVVGGLSVDGATLLNGNTNVVGTFDVTGNVVLNSAAGMQTTTVDNLVALGNGTFTGNVSGANAAFTGTLGVNGAATLNSTLSVAGFISNPGPTVTINDNLQVNGDGTFTGDITAVNGTFNGLEVDDLLVNNDAFVGHDLVVGNDIEAGNNLSVIANAEIGGTLLVNDEATFLNNVNTLGNILVAGTISTPGVGPLVVDDNLQVNGNGTFTGNVGAVNGAFSGTLGVTGATTLNGATQINNTLGVTGATTLSNTLGVTGATTLGSTLSVAGFISNPGATVTVDDNLQVNGNGTFTGNIGAVNGTFSGNLGVTGISTLATTNVNGAATFANTAAFNGSNVNFANGTEFRMNGDAGAAGEILVSRGAGLAPEWTNSVSLLNVDNLNVVFDATIGDELTVGGLTTLEDDLDVQGNLDVWGEASIGTDLTVGSDLIVTNNLDVVLGNIRALAGNVEAGVDVKATRDVVAGRDVTADRNVAADFDVTAGQDVKAVRDVVGGRDLTAGRDVTAAQDVKATRDLTAGRDVTAAQDVKATRDVTAGQDVKATRDLIAGRNLVVAVDAFVNGALDVTKDATINQSLVVKQNATVDQNVTVGQQLTVNQQSTLKGATEVQSDLSVSNGAFTVVTDGKDVMIGNTAGFSKPSASSDLYASGNIQAGGSIFGVINPGLTPGSVTFGGPAGEIAQDNAKLFFDNGTDRLGIGNNAPTATLDVTGTAKVSGNTTIGGTATIAGATQVNNDLTVTGATSLQATAVNGNLNANSRLIMSFTTAANLAALVTAINSGNTVIQYETTDAAELDLTGAGFNPTGTTGRIIYIINNSTMGNVTAGTALNPVQVKQNQMVALIYNGTSWIPMAN